MTNGTANENYAFDGVGNRTASHLSPIYNYQPNNRLTNTATVSYVYNSNGNMVSKTDVSGTTQYIWDYENRLKQVLLPSGQNVVYKYDALGRRIERNVNNGASWQKFTYDGQDVMLDQNSDGTSVTYLNGLGIDNKLRQTVNGQAQYFLSDHLGSTNALADASGNIVSSTNYDSFGNATNANFPTRYQFTGREFDSFTGLQYSRARWYDANLGRFISEDPIGFEGGDINLYGYVWNNPNNFVDPRGLDVRAYYYRKGGRDDGGRLEVYDNDKPPTQVWTDNPSNDVNQPVGDYGWQYKGNVVDKGLFSGDGTSCKNEPSCELTPFSGPIPQGSYVIANDPNPQKRGADRWYGLFRSQSDGSFSDHAPIDGGVLRGNFRWHLGGTSYGCLTFDWKLRETYKKLDGLLQGTSRTPFRNSTIPKKVSEDQGFGTLTVY